MPPTGTPELVDRVMADPPAVHPGAPGDVWSTDRDAYVLLASLIGPGTRTIETGCGTSTAIFAVRGSEHLCATLIQFEADAFLDWARNHDVATDHVRFLIGPSHETLPGLGEGPFDLVFIDGGHMFPAPVIDWFYLVSKLKPGGVVFVDDVNLPAPRLIADYMESLAPGWERVERHDKWAAYRLSHPTEPGEWELPAAGTSLYGSNGRFERLGRQVDGLVRRVRSRH
jgi:predicted O-methyltransferase YrrM